MLYRSNMCAHLNPSKCNLLGEKLNSSWIKIFKVYWAIQHYVVMLQITSFYYRLIWRFDVLGGDTDFAKKGFLWHVQLIGRMLYIKNFKYRLIENINIFFQNIRWRLFLKRVVTFWNAKKIKTTVFTAVYFNLLRKSVTNLLSIVTNYFGVCLKHSVFLPSFKERYMVWFQNQVVFSCKVVTFSLYLFNCYLLLPLAHLRDTRL